MGKRLSKLGLIILVALICITFFYSARQTPFQAYRLDEKDSATCVTHTLDERANEVGAAPVVGCMLEKHTLSDSNWAELGLSDERHRSFDLAFVEMLENGEAFGEGQLSSLKDRLSHSEQKVVLTYVHGWRHNASWRNGNVQRFRVMLAYMRSFLNTRCVATGAYCDAELVGVYAGWRGASLYEEQFENASETSTLSTVAALPTLFSRKAESERLAAGEDGALGQLFAVLNSALSLDVSSDEADKLMITGHSLGGNMLITHLSGNAVEVVGEHRIGDTLDPIMGDLVVLLNPASEAKNWTAIQEAERTLSGFENHTQNPVLFSDVNSNHGKAGIKWRNLYPTTQRPVMLSITATDNWNSVEDVDGITNFDTATGLAFKAYAFLRLAFAEDERTTIGHLLPEYAKNSPRRLIPESATFGASHDFIINSGVCLGGENCGNSGRTSFANAMDHVSSWCAPNTGGLLASRQQMSQRNGGFSNNWDWRVDVGQPKNFAEIQFRHQLALKNPDRFVASMASPNTPFWNTRAADNAISEHDGIYSYPLWCGLAQIWLDPITAQR